MVLVCRGIRSEYIWCVWVIGYIWVVIVDGCFGCICVFSWVFSGFGGVLIDSLVGLDGVVVRFLMSL